MASRHCQLIGFSDDLISARMKVAGRPGRPAHLDRDGRRGHVMPSPVNDRGCESIGALGGLRAFYGGIGFVLSTPSVWGWSLVPVGFMALLSLGLCGLSWWGAWEASKGLVGGENLGTW